MMVAAAAADTVVLCALLAFVVSGTVHVTTAAAGTDVSCALLVHVVTSFVVVVVDAVHWPVSCAALSTPVACTVVPDALPTDARRLLTGGALSSSARSTLRLVVVAACALRSASRRNTTFLSAPTRLVTSLLRDATGVPAAVVRGDVRAGRLSLDAALADAFVIASRRDLLAASLESSRCYTLPPSLK